LIERSLSGGEERDVLLALYAWAYVPVEDGIFYVVRELQGGFSLLFLDFATRKVVTLHTYHNSMANAGLTVSPDRKAIVSWGSDAPSVRAADLMMLAPFR
jgi:hypothetical protein